MNEQLATFAFDPELSPGARNAIETCLRVQPGEKTTLITDLASLEIAASLAHELRQRAPQFQAWVLEEVASRPLRDMPAEILADMETSHVAYSLSMPSRANCAAGCR